MKYLVDTSALVRLQRNQTTSAWDELVARGHLAVCEPVLAETLTIADAKHYLQVEEKIVRLYPWVGIPDDIWRMVEAIRHELVEPSVYQGVSVADLVVAATAVQLKLAVLHEDGDFETVARFVPELRQRRMSVGPA